MQKEPPKLRLRVIEPMTTDSSDRDSSEATSDTIPESTPNDSDDSEGPEEPTDTTDDTEKDPIRKQRNAKIKDIQDAIREAKAKQKEGKPLRLKKKQ